MSNINALNTLLKSIDSADQLIEEYRKRIPNELAPTSNVRETARDALDYCSGATQFVMHFLTGNEAMYMKTQRGTRKDLTSKTVSELFGKVKGTGALRIGYIVFKGDPGHECVFAGAGNQWAFYQANVNGATEKRYTLAPKLNPMQKNWNVFDMSADQFAEFFTGLTDSGYSNRLFGKPMDKWNFAAFTSTGQNLLL